jgi:uncharacterized protein (TIGR02646 family)
MMPCVRGPAPALLAQHTEKLTAEHVARRTTSAGHRLRWPTIEKLSLLAVVRDALRLMTREHCAYCDAHPIGAAGEEQIDHFQPCSRFPQLAYAWDNLFFVCMRCNKDKRDRWDPLLLRPDANGFSFDRYFQYRFDTGDLAPNARASAEDQLRARYTIETLGLNRADACKARRQTVRLLTRIASELEPDDVPYRYLVPLCGE